MTDRILDLSQEPAHLSVWQGLLRIEKKDGGMHAMPFEEVAVVVGTHRQLTFTQAFFAQLALQGGVFVACDDKSRPVGMMLPLEGHHLQAERFMVQAAAGVPVKKRMWQAIVQKKIQAQAGALLQMRSEDYGLGRMAEKVRSGDTENMEGQAARRYWQHLFEDNPKFQRNRDLPGRNALLNFGYTVLRAITARAICAAGLHPTLGIHHHNRYDAYALADDLMEPFRPMIDVAVAVYTASPNEDYALDRDAKRVMYQVLYDPILLDGEQRSLFDAMTRICASVDKVFRGERKSILLPEF